MPMIETPDGLAMQDAGDCSSTQSSTDRARLHVERSRACSRVTPSASADVVDPERLGERTPGHLVEDLHAAFGRHRARAVHAKGTILTGSFHPSAAARTLCSATLFERPLPVIARFSNFTGLPTIPDNDPHGQPRGLALKFLLPGGSNYDVVSHSFDGFPVATATQFGEFLLAIATSGPEAEKPTALDRFLADHPAAADFLASQMPPPESFATTAYFGVNAFQFTSLSGESRFVRYRFLPEDGERYLDAEALATRGPDYLQREIATRVTRAPARFTWLAQIAEPGDPIEDPTQNWPRERAVIELGSISLASAIPPSGVADHALLFLPGSTPPGIAVADPMLTVRNAAYPISYAERVADS